MTKKTVTADGKKSQMTRNSAIRATIEPGFLL